MVPTKKQTAENMVEISKEDTKGYRNRKAYTIWLENSWRGVKRNDFTVASL